MNNEELFSTPTCVQTQMLPMFRVSSLLADDAMKDANITSLTTPGSVSMAMTTVMTSTTSHLKTASKPFQVSSCSTSAPGYQKPPQESPLSGYTMGQTRPHYRSPMTACSVLHLLAEIKHWGFCRHRNIPMAFQVAQQTCLLSPCQLRTVLFKTLRTFRESRQNCLELWLPSKPEVFYHQASHLRFMLMLWSFHI